MLVFDSFFIDFVNCLDWFASFFVYLVVVTVFYMIVLFICDSLAAVDCLLLWFVC